ncbi:DUF2312 domain-containing protein [Ketogulonicigenium vulgare]|uniref:DUF2312 domain-containing protein n=1 Tax=Ketogulonicigenium vulgare TaxID=92945 RepID=UPI0023592654|nr:DUF2312 domain-containing protein [Ketogulonicigenium vulgare]
MSSGGHTTVSVAGGGTQDLSPAAMAWAQAQQDNAPLPASGKVPHKNTDADKQVADAAFAASADEIRSIIERYEALESEKALVVAQMKEVMAEAKARGYDTKALRRIIALRKRDANDVAEEDAILEIYKTALGM